MMDNETQQVILRHSVEMKKDAVSSGQEKIEKNMSALSAGQEELKNDVSAVKNDIKTEISAEKNMTEISAVKKDIQDKIVDRISDMETKINAGKEKLRQEISAFQERIKPGQAKFEGRVTCTLDTQLKSVTTQVEQQAHEVRGDFNKGVTGDTGRVQSRDTSHSAELRDPTGCGGRLNEAHRQRKRRG
jgi:chromosome segregation ATPase